MAKFTGAFRRKGIVIDVYMADDEATIPCSIAIRSANGKALDFAQHAEDIAEFVQKMVGHQQQQQKTVGPSGK